MQAGHVDILSSILAKKPNLNIQDSEGKTPLILASEKGDIETLNALLHEDVIDLASNSICQVDVSYNSLYKNDIELSVGQKMGRTAVHAAVESGYLEVVRCLIGAFPDARDIANMVKRI